MPGLPLRRFAAVLPLLLLASSSAVLRAQQDDETVEWLGDYKQGLAEAKRTGKPMFVEYRCEP